MKVRLAFSLPALETQELAAAVEAWCEVLNGYVPSVRINDCYLHAIKGRESTFPIAVTDICQAWQAIAREESEQAKRRPHCFVCHGRKFEMIYDPKTDTEFEKECPFCLGDISSAIEKVN